MRYRFNPPPNWPTPPNPNWKPPAGWTPPQEWGPPPDGWQLWVPVKRSVWAHPGMIATYVTVGVLFSVIVGTAGGTGAPSSDPTPTSVAVPSPTNVSTYTPSTEPTTHYTPSDEPTVTEPTAFKKITQRRWKKIAKDPDSHIAEAIVVYGQVTQFDAATGTDTFRANVGGDRDSCAYGYCDYPTNTILNGDENELADLVTDDVFRAKVEVAGSLDYDTQIGGSTTVPLLIVHKVKVLS